MPIIWPDFREGEFDQTGTPGVVMFCTSGKSKNWLYFIEEKAQHMLSEAMLILLKEVLNYKCTCRFLTCIIHKNITLTPT